MRRVRSSLDLFAAPDDTFISRISKHLARYENIRGSLVRDTFESAKRFLITRHVSLWLPVYASIHLNVSLFKTISISARRYLLG